ncbi:MAG: GGDEF domain-containing protein [Lachnospiraceae bacterium]|nr:GGDEF domain-containing protein [Lachnospiraceae bacterium]
MQELYKSTTRILLKIMLVSTIAAFVLELAFVGFRYADGYSTVRELQEEISNQCVIPTLAAVAVYCIMYWLLDSPNVKREIKRCASFIGIALICFTITASHSEYMSLCSLFVIPILYSSIYGETKYIRLSTEICILLQLIVIIIRLLNADETTFTGVSEGVVSILILFFSMYFANIIRTFVEANSQFMEKQMQQQEHLSSQISVDAMTGLYNHTAFYDELDRLIKETDRTKQKLCISVVDIDNFKSVNDTFGHSRGDEVLIYLADVLKTVCKDHIVCRYGGEEFAVIFMDCSLKESATIMEAVLDNFRNHKFEWCDRAITFSCGVCQHYDIRINSEELFKQADKYLYKAKREGKNRIVSE